MSPQERFYSLQFQFMIVRYVGFNGDSFRIDQKLGGPFAEIEGFLSSTQAVGVAERARKDAVRKLEQSTIFRIDVDKHFRLNDGKEEESVMYYQSIIRDLNDLVKLVILNSSSTFTLSEFAALSPDERADLKSKNLCYRAYFDNDIRAPLILPSIDLDNWVDFSFSSEQ